MKNVTLFLVGIIISLNAFSQIVFDVLSNSCDTNVVGAFPFEYGGELDGGVSDWGTPDITNPINAIQGCLVLVNDGVAGTTTFGTPTITVNNSVLGCDSTNWTQDLTGKIAVIFRGICNFSLKAYNAQKRGAIGVVIINHTGSPIPMSGGAFGTLVTIPVIQIGRADGDELLACLDTTCNGIVGFIGNKVGFYANDMGSRLGYFLMPENLATPQHLAPNGTIFPVDLGLYAYNTGTSAQIGATATVTVVRQSNGSTVYSQTSAPLDFNALDSTFVDTQYIDLGTYAPSVWNIDTYTVTYTLNATSDEYLLDNSFSYEFKITDPIFGYYAKSRTNNVGKPIYTTSYSLNQMDNYDSWETCITYKTSSSYVYNSMQWFKGLTFVATPTGYDIINELIEIRAYEWNDVFTDIYSPPTFDNLVLLDSTPHTFLDNNPIVDVNFNNSISIMPDKRYLFCVRNYINDSVRIGFDEGINYNATVNNYLQPMFPVMIENSGNPNSWFLHGFGIETVPSIVINFDHEVGVNESQSLKDYFPYPNPVTNLLTVPLRKKVEGKVLVEVFDLTGKLVLTENNTIGDEALKLNVASISNGAYLFKLTFANGTSDQYKISVNR